MLPWTIGDRDEIEVAYTLTRELLGPGPRHRSGPAVRDHAFHMLGVERLVALIDPDNAASSHVARNIGMHLEQTVDGIAGDGVPTDIYSMQAVDCPDGSTDSDRSPRGAARRVLE